MLQKIRFFDKKDPKLSLSELLSWMTIFKSIHMAFYVNPSLPFIFLSESVKIRLLHALTLSLLPKNHMLFIVSIQCACSRRVHIEGHMNRFEYCHPDNNSDNDSFGSFLSKNLLQHNSVEIKRNRSEVSSKWNKCRIYVRDQLDRCRWMERTQ
jgi:hypothetical protein